MKYELKTEKFSGPLEKLLELIEAKKMEITDLSIAEVTADFLNYVRSIEGSHPRLVADFIVVAARLLLIKSKTLFPNLEISAEEEADIKDLENRLKRYSNFKPAIVLFKELYEVKNFSISRPYLQNREPIFYPAENIKIENLKSSISEIFRVLSKFAVESEKIELTLIKLEEKIEEIAKKVESGIQQFSSLSKERTKTEIIVLFLALLHLLKDEIIKAEQEERFSDIIIEKSDKINNQ